MERRCNFRIYPNRAQMAQMERNFGCVRFVYNYFLVKRKEAYENGRGIIGYNEMCRDMTQLKRREGFEWLCEADHNSLQRALKQLDLAFQSFFRNVKQKGTAPGFPAFKSKRSPRQSYTSPASVPRRYVDRQGRVREYGSSVALCERGIKLPKLGVVRCRVSRKAEGRILSATVSRTAGGRYFVSVLFTDWEPERLERSGEEAGIRLGIRTLATLSDGTEIGNPRYFSRSQERIAHLQRELARKTSGSRNSEKVRQKLARVYEHVHAQKADHLQKVTTGLVREYDVLCVRAEARERLARDARFAGLLSDAGWGEFVRLLSYKCMWYGKELVKIDRYYPSTRTCSACGYVNEELGRRKSTGEWECPKCHVRHGRALNAARNILEEGKRLREAGSAAFLRTAE